MGHATFSTAYRSAVRVAVVTTIILLVPLVAMQLTDEVAWSLLDFCVAGGLLFGAGLTFELAVRRAAGSTAYRAAMGIAVAAALILVWANLAVGLIGAEGHPANLVYVGVLAIAIVGAGFARLQPRGMALAMTATALAQALVASIALFAGWGSPESGPSEIVLLNGFFVTLFAGSAWLFWRAAQGPSEQGES